jgi:hypothetical protein
MQEPYGEGLVASHTDPESHAWPVERLDAKR